MLTIWLHQLSSCSYPFVPAFYFFPIKKKIRPLCQRKLHSTAYPSVHFLPNIGRNIIRPEEIVSIFICPIAKHAHSIHHNTFFRQLVFGRKPIEHKFSPEKRIFEGFLYPIRNWFPSISHLQYHFRQSLHKHVHNRI